MIGIEQLAIGIWPWLGRNWAFVAIGATCLSLLAFVAIVVGKYVRICLNLFADTPPSLLAGHTDFKHVHGERVRFRSFDGTSLAGMWIHAKDRDAHGGTIVFCHEFGSDMQSWARYGKPLVEAGFDVFTFDFRAHGQSSGSAKYKCVQWPSDKELEDVLGACAYVESVLAAEGQPTDVGLFGISRGAAAGILASASDPNIKAIVSDSAFSTADTVVDLMKRWANIFARVKLVYKSHPEVFWKLLAWLVLKFAQPKLKRRFPSVKSALKDMKARGMFFIHGQRDNYVSAEQTRILYRAAPKPKYLWVVKGARHNQSVAAEPEQYASSTVAFFKKYLEGLDVNDSDIHESNDQ